MKFNYIQQYTQLFNLTTTFYLTSSVNKLAFCVHIENLRHMSGFIYTVWRVVLFFVLLQSYPDDRKPDLKMLVINNM
jgi:hypothetical protein